MLEVCGEFDGSSAVGTDKLKYVDNNRSEIDELRKIYVNICAIRRKHQQLIEETTVKRAENQQRLADERSRLESLEELHRETARQMKTLPTGSDEQKTCIMKYRTEVEELENERRIIDDLEFQMFETDAHFDEQKELIQQQLTIEQGKLSDIERQHSTSDSLSSPPPPISPTASCDKNDSSSVFDSVTTTSSKDCSSQQEASVDNESLSSVDPLHERLYIAENSSDEGVSSGSQKPADCRSDDSVESLTTTSGSHLSSPCRVHCTADDQSHSNVLDPLSVSTDQDSPCPGECPSDRTPGDRSVSFSVPGHCDRSLDSDEWSSASSERQLDNETDVSQRIREIQRMLVAAHSHRERLLQQTGLTDEETSLHRPFPCEDQTLNGENQVNDVIRRNNNVRCQSRPLTRYLPVRDQPLDLLGFVEQAGHYVQRCSADVTVTSDSARGFLVKMGGRIRTWRRRWFVFDRVARQLSYYVDQTQLKRPKGNIRFSSIEDVYVFDGLSSIKSPCPELTFCLKTTRRTYYIVAPSSEVRQLWMDIIFTGAEGYREFV